MSINTIVYSWKRSLPGRERLSASHFREFSEFLDRMRQDGLVASFEPIFLEPNGANLGGFFLIKGEDEKLGQMLDRPEWREHVIRSMTHLDEPLLSYGASGDMARQWMDIWLAKLPP
jgi:hypothetical protein